MLHDPLDPSELKKEELALFKKYLRGVFILILDGNFASRETLTQTLVSLGAEPKYIRTAMNVEEAKREIQNFHPKLILSEYSFEDGLGVSALASEAPEVRAAADYLFFLITSQTTQAAVAKAVEADVDQFLFKPYSQKKLQEMLVRTTLAKLYPEEYWRAIRAGKEALFVNAFEEAEKQFTLALKQSVDPALAHFYLGQTKLMRNQISAAKQEFALGLESNEIHYKCLMGMYETLMSENLQQEAYTVLRQVVSKFPENPERLTKALGLAVQTGHYRDIGRFYGVYEFISERPKPLVRHMSSALSVCGRYHLMKNEKERAMRSFERAVLTSSAEPKYLRYIVENLKRYGHEEEAAQFIQRYPHLKRPASAA